MGNPNIRTIRGTITGQQAYATAATTCTMCGHKYTYTYERGGGTNTFACERGDIADGQN